MAKRKEQTPKVDEGKDKIENTNVEISNEEQTPKMEKTQKGKKSKKEEGIKINVTPMEDEKPKEDVDKSNQNTKEIPADVDALLKMHDNYESLYIDKVSSVYNAKTFKKEINPNAELYINPYFKK